MSNIRFMYLRNEKGVPVACVAYQVSVGVANFGLSVHNPADQWDRKIARFMAAGSLILEPTAVGLDYGGKTTFSIARAIATCTHFPTRAKKAAKLWVENANSLAAKESTWALQSVTEIVKDISRN